MNACEIKIENNIPVVKTYPKLMQELLTYTNFDVIQSIDLYGITLLDEFKDLGIENPGLSNILGFIEQDYVNDSSPLNAEEKQLLLDLSLTQDENTSENFNDTFIQAFTVDGKFGIDLEKLEQSGIFSESELLEISDNIASLKTVYYKLLGSDQIIPKISTKYSIQTGSLEKQNPDKFLQNILDNYSGLTTEEQILDKARLIGDDIVLNNTSLIPQILKDVSNRQLLVQYETDEYSDSLAKKVQNNIFTQIEQTLDMNQDFTGFLNQVQFFREIDPLLFRQNRMMLDQYVRNLELQAQDFGINIDGFADISQNKTFDETVQMLDSLYNFIYDVQTQNPNLTESLSIYSTDHSNFFGLEPRYVEKSVEKLQKDGVYLHLETNQSDEIMFSQYGLINTGNGIYQKIQNNKTSEELYQIIFDNPGLLSKNVYSVSVKESNRDLILDDIDQYVSNRAKQYLTENSDIETLKRMVAYDILLDNTKTSNAKNFQGNLDLDAQRFLIDFNKTILKNPELKELFYFSNRGLESRQVIGDYTIRQLQNNLPQAAFRDLVKYAKISGNSSLEYLTNFENDLQPQNQRDFYANNLSELPVFEGDYYKENGLVVADSNQEFLKIKNELYEQVAPNVYGLVERNPRYFNSNLQKPEYDGSITVDKQKQEGGKISVQKVKEINSNEIEFC